MDVLADGAWEKIFKVKPAVFTAEEKRAWLDKNTDVALGSDAFFPFGDNIGYELYWNPFIPSLISKGQDTDMRNLFVGS